MKHEKPSTNLAIIVGDAADGSGVVLDEATPFITRAPEELVKNIQENYKSGNYHTIKDHVIKDGIELIEASTIIDGKRFCFQVLDNEILSIDGGKTTYFVPK